jgi:hypothetical protein
MRRVMAFIFSIALLSFFGFPASSIAAPKTCITLYEHINFKGKSKTFCKDDKDLKNNDFNDKASSLIVHGNKIIYIYQHKNHKGKRAGVSGSDEAGGKHSDLRNWEGWNWNDKISSLKYMT